MRVYLAGSIHGGRKFAFGLKEIARHIRDLGHEVLSEGFVITLAKQDRGPKRSERTIFRRDTALIRKCDAFIAEVSQASHGVGYEHALAESLGKPILLLRHNLLSGKKAKSAFLTGTGYRKLKFSYYNKRSLPKILRRFFDRLIKS